MRDGLRSGTGLALVLALSLGLTAGAHGFQHRGTAPDHEGSRCHCVGVCHGAAPTPLPEARTAPPVPPFSAPRRDPPPTDDRGPVLRIPYLLPYANGPPGR